MSTADELVEAMDADGVDASVVMGMGWTDHGLAVEVNDYLAESARRATPAGCTGSAASTRPGATERRGRPSGAPPQVSSALASCTPTPRATKLATSG